MAQYFITTTVPANTDWSALVGKLTAAGLPVLDVQTSEAYPGQIILVSDNDLTQAQKDQASGIVAGWDPRPRISRPLYAIYSDLTALTAAQQTAVWTNISALTNGVERYLFDTGPNTAAIVVMDWGVKSSGAVGAALTAARFRIVAMYVQDNPKYLVNPSFASTVNVPGDQPITQ
jgi:hypothetical protein